MSKYLKKYALYKKNVLNKKSIFEGEKRLFTHLPRTLGVEGKVILKFQIRTCIFIADSDFPLEIT